MIKWKKEKKIGDSWLIYSEDSHFLIHISKFKASGILYYYFSLEDKKKQYPHFYSFSITDRHKGIKKAKEIIEQYLKKVKNDKISQKKETNSAVKKFEKAMKSRRVQKKTRQRQKEIKNYNNVIISPKTKPKTEAKTMARKSTKRKTKRKLAGNALKQKAYALLKKGVTKLVRTRGRSYNTRYKGKKSVGVYIYELKDRK